MKVKILISKIIKFLCCALRSQNMYTNYMHKSCLSFTFSWFMNYKNSWLMNCIKWENLNLKLTSSFLISTFLPMHKMSIAHNTCGITSSRELSAALVILTKFVCNGLIIRKKKIIKAQDLCVPVEKIRKVKENLCHILVQDTFKYLPMVWIRLASLKKK